MRKSNRKFIILLLLASNMTYACLRESIVGASEADISLITQALEVYLYDCGFFPKTNVGIKGLAEKGSCQKWDGPYIRSKEMLTDHWGNEYVYVIPGIHNPNSYDLFSMGKDEISDTEDDVNNWDKQFSWRKYYKDPWYTKLMLSIFCD